MYNYLTVCCCCMKGYLHKDVKEKTGMMYLAGKQALLYFDNNTCVS